MDNENEQQKQEKKEKKLNELLTSAIVDIYVGPESQHWPLHERLLCYHSPFFSRIFYAEDKDPSKKSRGSKSYGLPDEDEYTFELLVGWLYSRAIRAPQQEKDLGPLLDLYLLSQTLEMQKLGEDVVGYVREFYHTTSTYPGLRRVQYIYAETDEDNEMREMMVSSVARQLTTADKIPAHWAQALQRNGQLAVDIIRAIQQWHLEERSIPDFRDASRTRGRHSGGGFSAIMREGESLETENTGVDTNLGVESLASDMEKSQIGDSSQVKSDDDSGSMFSSTSNLIMNQVEEEDPPMVDISRVEVRRREPPDKSEDTGQHQQRQQRQQQRSDRGWRDFAKDEFKDRPEGIFILFAWVALMAWHGYGYLG